ncbi:MAG: ABC transporter permease subunit, partial [Planctomycetales bacterium]|nr:ABC transporter permease subunit [Planctomycetales bacterium]
CHVTTDQQLTSIGCHVTTDQQLTSINLPDKTPIERAFMGPKDDGVFLLSNGELWAADLNPGYPETTIASLFSRVWYEGYDEPKHEWQSSYAGVGPEMKLGLRPLIFGTVKATVYSMLFGAPLALLAAIYTSEVLSPRWRNSVKSSIEMMASLPSVVLGFLAGLVIAPFVQEIAPIVLCSFFTVPFFVALGAFAWQQLPHRASLRIAPYRLWFVLVAIGCGVYAATSCGGLVERLFFADDISLWLDGQKGNGVGAWMLLLLPISSLVVAVCVTLFVNPMLVRRASGWSRRTFTIANLLKFVFAAAAAMVLALACSAALNAIGFDPRGSFVGTYEQRNAMVVGFGMGFAIIPIIYTIAEDALSTVPSHLRSASLGAGATPWQTAVRVVVPTAMSGLFSALMIGLGRAVGETMIVLMAAGNTPIEDWNAFNGFRTLSANIATELPEAVRGSTHYRTLFFAALTLLVLTFCVNTVAEIVRLRFRKRAVQL